MSSLDLPADTSQAFEDIVGILGRKTQADVVLLADISGQLITAQGQDAAIDPSIVAALGAGQLTAMKELGRQIGDSEPSGTFLHESGHKRVYLCSVLESFVLIVVFSEDVPVGLVRLFTQRAVSELESLVGAFEEWVDTSDTFFDQWNDGGDDTDFDTALSEAFDEAFEEF